MARASELRLGEDDGRLALLIDGVVQSVAVEGAAVGGYWAALLPVVRPRRALVLGLGGGTVVQLLHRRFGPLPVVGVERDPEVLALAREQFGLELPGLAIVEADAFDYLDDCQERFDYICVDLFQGGQLQRAVIGRPFLRRLRELIRPGGEIAINLFLDRRADSHLQRIARVLPIRMTERVGKNLIVRAGRRGQGS
jgi:spermidine synthase